MMRLEIGDVVTSVQSHESVLWWELFTGVVIDMEEGDDEATIKFLRERFPSVLPVRGLKRCVLTFGGMVIL